MKFEIDVDDDIDKFLVQLGIAGSLATVGNLDPALPGILGELAKMRGKADIEGEDKRRTFISYLAIAFHALENEKRFYIANVEDGKHNIEGTNIDDDDLRVTRDIIMDAIINLIIQVEKIDRRRAEKKMEPEVFEEIFE